jgi:6-phosphofructokinase
MLTASLPPPAAPVQCLIPEVPFALYGESGMFAFLEKVLSERGHAVVCVAEGAGQEQLLSGEQKTDASGNPILRDVGTWLKSEIKAAFKDADIKYIDPSYLIRSIPTISGDRIYCKILAHNAVHAAFAGYTGGRAGGATGGLVLLRVDRGWGWWGGVPSRRALWPLCVVWCLVHADRRPEG